MGDRVIQVRRTTYRGVEGWKIIGQPDPRDHRRVSIFTEHETSARRIASKVKAGQEIGGADFDPQCEICYGLGDVFKREVGVAPYRIPCPSCGAE